MIEEIIQKIIEIMDYEDYNQQHIIFDRVNWKKYTIRLNLSGKGVIVDIEDY